MFYTYKDFFVQLNGNQVYANDAQLSLQANITPVYISQNRHAFEYVPENAIQGNLRMNYYLTGKDFIKDYQVTESNISGNFGGLYFNSGYLRSYNLNCVPNTPVIASTDLVFFEQLKGVFNPPAPGTTELNVLNFSDATITNLTGYAPEITDFIAGINYTYSADIKPVYYSATGTGLTAITPDRISYGRKEVNTEIIVDLLSGELPIQGRNGGIIVNFNHPNIPTLSESIRTSGVLVQKNITSSVGKTVRNSWSIIQHYTDLPPVITGFTSTPIGPGSGIQILGSNLLNTIGITYAGNVNSYFDFTVVNDGRVSGNIPADINSTGYIFLKSFGGEYTTSSGFNILYPNIDVLNVDPITGKYNDILTISGNNFYNIDKILFSGVWFKTGVVADSFRRINSQLIQVPVPEYSSWGEVFVISSNRQKTGISPFKFVNQPVISGFFPTTGISGALINFSGINLTGITGVLFNEIFVTGVTVTSNTGFFTYLPSGNVKGTVKVFGLSGINAFSRDIFYPIVTLTGISGSPNWVNTGVALSGINFQPSLMYSLGDNFYQVSFNGGITGFKLKDQYTLTGLVPIDAKTGPVYVFDTSGTNMYPSAISFTKRNNAPIVTRRYPDQCFSGQYFKVSLEGTGLFDTTGIILTGIEVGVNIGKSITGSGIEVFGDLLGKKVTLTGHFISGADACTTGLYDVLIVTKEGTGVSLMDRQRGYRIYRWPAYFGVVTT